MKIYFVLMDNCLFRCVARKKVLKDLCAKNFGNPPVRLLNNYVYIQFWFRYYKILNLYNFILVYSLFSAERKNKKHIFKFVFT